MDLRLRRCRAAPPSREADAREPIAQQDHTLDLRDDFLDVMRDQDERRPLAGDLPHPLGKIVTRHEIEAGRRLVEDPTVAFDDRRVA